ncbi:MAG: CvpA family protein [Bacilli bacterium]|nr:CvpA family protein [Bacilli bacterium]MBR6949947.1 CvpA family protein [Bacilli bacterium]
MKRKKKDFKKHGLLKSIIISLLFAGIYYYISYPALDIHNLGLWVYIISVLVVFLICQTVFHTGLVIEDLQTGKISVQNHKIMKLWLAVPAIIIILVLVAILNSAMLNAKKYYKRIEIDTTKTFQEDLPEVDFNKLPLLDKKSSSKLGDRVMGGMSELVSQYDVSDEYTQINYNDEIIRVTPLEYNGTIKWFTNRDKGITGYITVNSTTGKAKLIKLDKGLKYAPSALFNENLYRKLQFSYPTKNFDAINFEIDNSGNPYWVASVVKYHGINQRREVTGVVIFNPINGESKYYKLKDVPSWVDHVYEAELILEQVNDWGAYKNGYLNSVFTQRDVVATTTGYNYLAFNDDVYLYTGITSVLADESNIGFILTNMRTKETNFYSVAGAEEYSAMDSAKGQVQQMKYTSTFPLLINLNGQPTYLISLKDNAGLVKMYAFVDVVDYQKVVVTDASKGIEAAADAYLTQMGEESGTSKNTKTINVYGIKEVIIDGNTVYYFTDQNNQKYKVSIKVNKNRLPFLKEGEQVEIEYNKEQEVINITELK